MNFEATGRIKEIYPTQQVSDRYSKREFVLEMSEAGRDGQTFTEYPKFTLSQAKTSVLDNFRTGDNVKVAFNLKGRAYEKNGSSTYFNELAAWRIEKA